MRYLVTGGSGYIGSRLVQRLLDHDDTERILVADVRPPRAFNPTVEYVQMDVRDKAKVRDVINREKPDVLVHLAFILNPMHDEDAMYDIDVGGTQNVLEAAEGAGIQQLLVTSSTTAYGAFPDNPEPIPEDHPVRGVPDFEYARDKAECDRLCQLWALRNPDRVMTIVRPCIVMGPNVDNYIVRLWTDQPFQADFGLPDNDYQFIHEDDLVDAISGLIAGKHSGAYNIAGDGVVPGGELAQMIGMPRRRIPLKLYWRLAAAMWKLRQSETPPGNLHFAIHPWVASNEKVKATLGWQPRYSSLEAFQEAMRARGKLPAEEAPVSTDVGAPVGV